MPAHDEYWFDHERLEVYQEAVGFIAWLSSILEEAIQRIVRMLMGLIKRNSTREYDKGNSAP
jgi:hypothetical protein